MSSSISTNLNLHPSKNQDDQYIYKIPPIERRALCAILDELNVWPILATDHMGYSKADLQDIKNKVGSGTGKSPSDELLNMWGDLNHTVTELFILLYRMQQYTAMDVIKSLVDVKYHRLITRDQPDLSNLLHRSKNSKSIKILNCNSSSGISNSNNETSTSDNYTTTSDQSNTTASLNMRNVKSYASTIPQIDYNELVVATNNWSDNHILGKGGFGTVYRGTWKQTEVAIKKIVYHGDGGDKVQIQQSLNELKHLNSCRHDNILPLYGYSINGAEPCLVYQLMIGGSLENRLNSKNYEPLTWSQRLNIACGTARGLQYLHTFREKPLIHGDIKPANILLDPCNQPRIGDFGLAREGPNALNSSMEVSRVYGTKPYLPIEFVRNKSLSTKIDTYSFGVVLLEMFTGLRAYDKWRVHPLLTRHIMATPVTNEDLIDKNLHVNDDVIAICKRVIDLGRVCISDRPEQRPEMVAVLHHLENR